MGIIKRWKERRLQRRKLKEMSAYASVFKTLDTMQEKGLLAWDRQARRLFIELPLAIVMMPNAETWRNFIQNLYLWQYSKECEQAWADFLQKEELKAVREYATKAATVPAASPAGKKPLTRGDINRIREARRMEILQSDMQPPKVEGFEFFIVSPPDLGVSDTPLHQQGGAGGGSAPVGQLTAVGHFDPDTERIEMATWEEVSNLIHKES